MIGLFILHYATDVMTRACLEKLLDDPTLPSDCQIIVIDNASPKHFKCADTRVQVERLPRNLGIIDAFNAIQTGATFDLYLNWNNDLLPAHGAVKRLGDLAQDPRLGVVAPGTSDRGTGEMYRTEWGSFHDINMSHIDNHAWGFTHKLVQQVGFPDALDHPHRAHWFANRLYCWKARRAGFKVVCAKSTYVYHFGGKYDAEAHSAGLAWITARLGDRVQEAL
jgi:GT2 family glycosyltransferase